MAILQAPYIFTETRLNLEQSYAGSTIELSLPSSNPSTFVNPTPPARAIISDIQIGSDEATFSRLHIASEASVVFRRHERSPRCFLWRLLDERRALEIQTVDLTCDTLSKGDTSLTILLRFPAALRPFGLAFADPDDRDVLNVFAITTNDQLYTLALHRDFFANPRATDPPPADWCRIFSPPAFNIYRPYRLTAINSLELFVSLPASRLLRLTRRPGDDGLQWQETHFTDGGLSQTLRRAIVPSGFFGGRSTVKFGNTELDPEAAAAIALSPDGMLIFAVCLDHTVKLWNVETGRVVSQMDLLGNRIQEQQPATKYTIAPTQRQLLQVVDTLGQAGDIYYVVTYSPKHRQFKFFGMVNQDAGSDGLRDVKPNFEFTPPIDDLLDTTIWNLEEFCFIPRKNWRETQLWIRVVSGSVSRVYTVTFNLFDKERDLEATWRHGWQSVSAGRQTQDMLNLEAPSDLRRHIIPASCTDQWLDFLFYPGRFTVPTLETALTIYTRELVGTLSAAPRITANAALKERVCRAVMTSADNQINPNATQPDLEQILAAQWRMFYNILKDLHRRRGDTLSFELDLVEQIPWVVCADTISPVRACSELERIDLNKNLEDDRSGMSVILDAADFLRKNMTSSFTLNFDRAVMAEAIEEPSTSVHDRMEALIGRFDLRDQVSDESFDLLMERCGGDDGDVILTTKDFLEPVQAMTQEPTGRRNTEYITGYGLKLLTRATQETVLLHRKQLHELLLLLLVLVSEYGSDLDEYLDPPTIYVALIDKIREYAVLQFLQKNLRRVDQQSPRRGSISTDSPTARLGSSDLSSKRSVTLTLMESMFSIGWTSSMIQPQDLPMPELITYWARWWIASTDLSTQYGGFTAHILADLLKHGEHLLAYDFLPFIPTTGWSTYLRGRLSLATGEFDKAESCFKKSAFALGNIRHHHSLGYELTDNVALGYFDINQSDTTELIDLTERDNFSDGLPRYYAHVISLFEKYKAHSYVADFANLALQSLALVTVQKGRSSSSSDARSPSNQDSAKLRLDFLNRLFTASLHTSRFRTAYTALSQIPNADLRKALLKQFVQSLIAQRRIPLLLSFPYAAFTQDVDNVLYELARTKAKNTASLTGAPAVGMVGGLRHFEILYAWRVKRGDLRGAAQACYEKLVRLKASSGETGRDPRDKRILDAYLVLINALCCVGKEEAWVVAEPEFSAAGAAGGEMELQHSAGKLGVGKKLVQETKASRSIKTLDDVRSEYQAELDKVSRMDAGKWGFGGGGAAEGEEMDVL